MKSKMYRAIRYVWRGLPYEFRAWLWAIRRGDPTTTGAVWLHRALRRIRSGSVTRSLKASAAPDHPAFLERVVTTPYVAHKLLKRADVQDALRKTSYQKFLDSYSELSQERPNYLVRSPPPHELLTAALADPALADALRLRDLQVLLTLADERTAIQIVSTPSLIEKLLDDDVVLAAVRRRALDDGPDSYATRIAQEIGGRPDYKRSLFDRLATNNSITAVRCGSSTVIASLADYGIAKELFVTGEFELAHFRNYLSLRPTRKRTHFVDVGANLGSHTLYAVRDADYSMALALEPDPRNLRLLRANLALNDVNERVTVMPIAAGKEDSIIALFQSSINWGDTRIFPVVQDGWDRIDVKTMPLDQIVNTKGINLPETTFWIDVQGAEVDVLEGAHECLSSGADLVIEFWPHELHRNGRLHTMVSILQATNRVIVDLENGQRILPTSLRDLTNEMLDLGDSAFLDLVLLAP